MPLHMCKTCHWWSHSLNNKEYGECDKIFGSEGDRLTHEEGLCEQWEARKEKTMQSCQTCNWWERLSRNTTLGVCWEITRRGTEWGLRAQRDCCEQWKARAEKEKPPGTCLACKWWKPYPDSDYGKCTKPDFHPNGRITYKFRDSFGCAELDEPSTTIDESALALKILKVFKCHRNESTRLARALAQELGLGRSQTDA